MGIDQPISGGVQRQDYKKTTAPKPSVAKAQTLVTTAKMGKALNSGSHNIFQMGKAPK